MVVNIECEKMFLFDENLAESVQFVQSDQTLLYPSVYSKVSYLSSVCGALRGMDTLSRDVTLSKLFYLPSENASTLNGKNLLHLGANSFLLE